MDAPLMAEFVAQLDSINGLADRWPGFIWRLVDEDPNDPAALSLGEATLINLSVWVGPKPLADFVYGMAHGAVMRRRREWFTAQSEANVVLWWIPRGTTPTVADAVQRLTQLRTAGPTAQAFTFRNLFSEPR